ncbi:MAG: YHS domain-containing protein [Planctomycetota bacterium]|jgi:YHS domain-containing protein
MRTDNVIKGIAARVALAAALLPIGQALAEDAAEDAVQTLCPVMVGNKIDPNIFVDYQGKRVFFCCQACKTAFSKSPEKYLPLLPQFGGASPSPTATRAGFSPRKLIVPLGITALSLMVITVALGLLRRLPGVKRATMLKWHKRFGIAALIVAAIHAAIVIAIH